MEEKSNEEILIESKTPMESKTSSKPLIAGIFLIIAGILSILTWLSVSLVDFSTIIDPTMFQQQGVNLSMQQIESIINICATIAIILAIFPIIGGIFSVTRRKWAVAILGGVLGLFIIGPIFISSILSLIGLILIALSKEEFK
ncbi:MAG: hypothetical protein DRN12_01260 [Thermoplasmata archaeon]|nr:MAG: hypothetical protein DRN12_01260 [Thermoplasmata archaeon]HEC89910.1 hypothetical protein [Thermoplasmatales archaeon]